ncbi:MAG: hypothetical protein FD161_2355 [Limisphaerales bacterium]|nr:MAG: hypothetical protein FD161_2355 [Limisphaerales bacterium]KAG0508688.1 MAG: hypothetical protein E1N63_2106 [Limisphaerales bacterium]TXT50338.1 MAG: hypothetical protein FD140_2409 [Limisphaerales bacterium]
MRGTASGRSHSASWRICLSLAMMAFGWLAAFRCEGAAAKVKLPRGVVITSESKTHVHAHISDLRLQEYPALTNLHALFTVYYVGAGTTDEKLEALSKLRFTNMVCVVFTDCPTVTDKGIEHLAKINTLTNLGLRQMTMTDVSCQALAERFHLDGINMPKCGRVTVEGLVRVAQSKSLSHFGFSLGKLGQAGLLRILGAAGPKLKRIDLDLDDANEALLDFPAVRQAANAKGISLFAVRKNGVSKF